MSTTAHIPAMSKVIQSKLDPHIVALAELVNGEIDDLRNFDLSREETLLKIQGSIAINNKLVVELVAYCNKLENKILDLTDQVATLKYKVKSLEK